jgi:hypothetical protein
MRRRDAPSRTTQRLLPPPSLTSPQAHTAVVLCICSAPRAGQAPRRAHACVAPRCKMLTVRALAGTRGAAPLRRSAALGAGSLFGRARVTTPAPRAPARQRRGSVRALALAGAGADDFRGPTNATLSLLRCCDALESPGTAAAAAAGALRAAAESAHAAWLSWHAFSRVHQVVDASLPCLRRHARAQPPLA